VRRLASLHVKLIPRGPLGSFPPGPDESGACAAAAIDAAALAAHIDHMAMKEQLNLTDAARERVAARFRALGEPTRLRVLERLFRGPASVTETLEFVGGTQANVSKHLSLLHAAGLLSRRKSGTRTVYAISDPTLKKICTIVCDGVERSARDEAEAVLGGSGRRSRRR
jgi:DNA-binding transcriptional ArsR family regulator